MRKWFRREEGEGAEQAKFQGEVEVLRPGGLGEIRSLLREMGVHPGGVEIMAPKGVFLLLRLRGVDPRAAAILKQEMLARGGEAALPWQVVEFSSQPVDVLLMGTLAQMEGLLRKLEIQPFFGLRSLKSGIERAIRQAVPGWRPPRDVAMLEREG